MKKQVVNEPAVSTTPNTFRRSTNEESSNGDFSDDDH